MRQRIVLGVAALLFIVIINGCSQYLPKEPTQFDIYYSFGVGEKNILDTKNNLYVKDMVCEESKEYIFQLNESEKTEIYNSILENDLFNIKEDFTQNCDSKGRCVELTPLNTANLKIFVDGKSKTIKWSAAYGVLLKSYPEQFNIDGKNNLEFTKFMNAKKVIDDIIYQKEKEMNIEQPRCGYR